LKFCCVHVEYPGKRGVIAGPLGVPGFLPRRFNIRISPRSDYENCADKNVGSGCHLRHMSGGAAKIAFGEPARTR
jgi:hypothetical protein